MDREPICDCDFGCDCGAEDYADEHNAIFRRVQDLDMMFLNGLLFIRRESLETLLMNGSRRINDLLAIKTQTVIISEPAEHAGYYFLWDEVYSFLFMHDDIDRYIILYGCMEDLFYHEVMANTDSGGGSEWTERAYDLWKDFVDTRLQCWNTEDPDCYDKVKKRYKDDLRRLFLEFMEEQDVNGRKEGV